MLGLASEIVAADWDLAFFRLSVGQTVAYSRAVLSACVERVLYANEYRMGLIIPGIGAQRQQVRHSSRLDIRERPIV